MKDSTLESPPPIIASSSRASASKPAPVSPPGRTAATSSTQAMQQPILMELSTSTSTSSIESSPFHQPSSRRLFHDTPTASQNPPKLDLVSPIASGSAHSEARTPTTSGGLDDQDVFGKIDHTPLRQETHSTSPLPNSRSLQLGDMLEYDLNVERFSGLSVGNIIAPQRNSSKKPPKRLPTDPNSTTASPTPLSRSVARTRSALTSIAVNKATGAAEDGRASSSDTRDPFMHKSCPSADELSPHVKHHMAALQESPQTY